MTKEYLIEKIRSAYKNNAVKNKIRKVPEEDTDLLLNEDVNRFLQLIRRSLYSSKRLTFKQWLQEIEDLIDVIT